VRVDQVSSLIDIWVAINDEHVIVKLEDALPIKDLREKYEFFYNGVETDLSEMIKRIV